MTEEQFMAMAAQADDMRARLFLEHCVGTEDETESVVQLVTQLVYQAAYCLGQVYGQNKTRVMKHLIILVVQLLEDLSEPLPN